MNEPSFEQYHLCNELLETLHLLNYTKPTKVQASVLNEIHKNCDILVKSRTGSGKTAAFSIPICEHIDWVKNKPQALILVPTRELALQVLEELSNIGRFKRIKVSTIFGKMPMDKQILELKQKTHVVVGTPGRVLDLITRGNLIVNELDYVVIDEADEMFFIGLRKQVEAILDLLPSNRTTMLFSATLDKEVITLSKHYLKDPVTITINEEETNKNLIDQIAYLTEEKTKEDLLLYVTMLENPESCMIFANTQVSVDTIHRLLVKKGYPCQKLHGGMEQKDRMQIMNDFKRNKFRYLVATDVAARGIDIDNITLIINYDMSRGTQNYVHRIGRTGRFFSTGKAITFFTPKEQRNLEAIEDYTKIPIQIYEQQVELTKEQKNAFYETIETPTIIKQANGTSINASITKLHINAGKKSKIRTNEIVATICSIDGITADDIGIIQITEIATFVEILNGKGVTVLEELQKKTIKGRIRKVHKARERS